ncbi:hypothetical protein LBMAG52_05290 [Planctomycetia bacterium]|nr:hypothetical protein LBMAG52_05290 [Planctomycetia bacterium]
MALVPSATGCELAWTWSTRDAIPGSPVIGKDGTIYVHSGDGLLHALNADGKPLRPPTKVGPPLGWATPLLDDSNQVWISAATGGLIRVDATGQTAARAFHRTTSRFDCTGIIVNGTLYIGSEDQFIHAIALDGDRGRELWSQREKIGLTGWYINSALGLTTNGTIVAVSRDAHLYAMRPDGSLACKIPLEGQAIGSPVLADDETLLVGLTRSTTNGTRASGRLIGISVSAHQEVWHCDLSCPIESTPVIGSSNQVYVGDNQGQIHAISLRSHQIEWSESVGSPVRSAGTILASGQVVFGLDDGSLVAVNTDSTALSLGWPKFLRTVGNATLV